MVFVVLVIGHGQGEGYLDSLGRLQLSRDRLLPLVLAAGLFLLTVAAMVTWLIALYSSFRVAGPLYRLTRNLEHQLEENNLESPLPIRRGDQLQHHSRLLGRAVDRLRESYLEIRILLRELSALDPGEQVRREQIIDRLRELRDGLRY